jgi:hypothetical protein
MPGPVIGTPRQLVPQDPSVFDSALTKAMRLIGDLLGDDDPAGQILGMASAMEVPGEVQGALTKAVTGIRNRIKAYHGSPHDFDRFSLDKIGTGEGAQAYGHGLYFAENEDVAKSYRDSLGAMADQYKAVEYGGVEYPGGTDRARLLRDVQKNGRAAVRQALEREIDRLTDYAPERADLLRGELEFVKGVNPDQVKFTGSGKMYEVAIDASPDEFLDWDKPLSQQPPKVQEAVTRVLPDVAKRVQVRPGYQKNNWIIELDGQLVGASNSEEQAWQNARDMIANMADPSLTGAGVYRQMSGTIGAIDPSGRAQASATDVLKNAGVKGIRYLDGSSRKAGEGSSNYVVFDDRLVDILRKYGVAGALGAGYTADQIRAAQAAQGAQ